MKTVVAARRRRNARAFTLVEAVISTFLVAVMFVAALKTVAASQLTQRRAALTWQGSLFARYLLSEILDQSYKDPDGTPVFGIETTNETSTTRADFDDVDDYSGWSGAPTDKDGVALSGSAGWTLTVTVEWVSSSDPTSVQTAETGVKRVTLIAKRSGVPQATLTALRTAGL